MFSAWGGCAPLGYIGEHTCAARFRKTIGFGLNLTANGHVFTIDGQALSYPVGANETLVLHCNENDDFTIVAKTPDA